MKNNKQTISLRPNNFEGFIGQNKIINTLKVVINSSQKQKRILDHILFYGPPGKGKTTLAYIISNQMNSKINYVQGILLEKKSDILSMFASIEENDVIFIDEIHSINKGLEELIFSAMEDYVIDIPIGPEGEKRIVRMKLKPFTLIGATTEISKLSKPIRDRFGMTFKLDEYSDQEISQIIQQSSKILGCEVNDNQSLIIASYSQGTPRIANKITKRVIDFAQYYNKGKVTNDVIFKTFNSLSIYKCGLTQPHIDYLKLLLEVFDQKPVSLDVIISLLNEDKKVIVTEIEPILLSKTFISKTSRGRQITRNGIDYLLSYNISPFNL